MKTKGILLTIISAVMFGATPVLASWTYGMGNTPVTLSFYRNLFALPALYLLMRMQGQTLRVGKGRLGHIALIGVAGCAATSIMLYSSYDYVGIGTATTLHFLYPVFVVVFCRLFYRERIGLVKILTLLAACAGMLFFFDKSSISSGAGVLLAAASGLTYAFYMVQVDKLGLKDMNPFKLSFFFGAAVSLTSLVYGGLTGQLTLALPPLAYLYMFLVGIGASVLGVVLLQQGIKLLGSATASIFCLFEPITSVVCGVAFLGEAIDLRKVVGCLLIFAAVSFLVAADQLAARKKLRANPPETAGTTP